MVKTRIKLAGIPMEIHALYMLPSSIGDYETEEEPAFTVRITEQDIENEREKSMAECAHEGIAYPDYSPAELQSTAVYRKIAFCFPWLSGGGGRKSVPLYSSVRHGKNHAHGFMWEE